MGLLSWLHPEAAIDPEIRTHIDRAVTLGEPLIAGIRGYDRQLAPAVTRALAYCRQLAAQIPGPVEISRSAFGADPVIHALFGSIEDIDLMLARSQCVREQLIGPDAPAIGQCCALLGMRRHQKDGFGPRLTGEVVSFDEPQTTLYFTDHTLAGPSSDIEKVRDWLVEAMFDGLVKNFAVQAAAARDEHGGLRPEHLLSGLVASLNRPEASLRLDPVTLTVDRTGIIAAGDAPGLDTLRFMELTGRDQRRWVLLLVHIERDEARRASERMEEARRHIVL